MAEETSSASVFCRWKCRPASSDADATAIIGRARWLRSIAIAKHRGHRRNSSGDARRGPTFNEGRNFFLPECARAGGRATSSTLALSTSVDSSSAEESGGLARLATIAGSTTHAGASVRPAVCELLARRVRCVRSGKKIPFRPKRVGLPLEKKNDFFLLTPPRDLVRLSDPLAPLARQGGVKPREDVSEEAGTHDRPTWVLSVRARAPSRSRLRRAFSFLQSAPRDRDDRVERRATEH